MATFTLILDPPSAGCTLKLDENTSITCDLEQGAFCVVVSNGTLGTTLDSAGPFPASKSNNPTFLVWFDSATQPTVCSVLYTGNNKTYEFTVPAAFRNIVGQAGAPDYNNSGTVEAWSEVSDASTEDPTTTEDCDYVFLIDGTPVHFEEDGIEYDSESGHSTSELESLAYTIILDKSRAHTIRLRPVSGIMTESVTWIVNNQTTLPAGWATDGYQVLGIPSYQNNPNVTYNNSDYNFIITAMVNGCYPTIIIALGEPTPVSSTGLTVAMTKNDTSTYVACFGTNNTWKTADDSSTPTPTLPSGISLLAQDGLAVEYDSENGRYDVTVPYDETGFKFCVLDPNDIDGDGDYVVDALEGFFTEDVTHNYSLLWGVRYSDGSRALTQVYTRIPLSDAGTYDITVMACNGTFAVNAPKARVNGVDTVYVQIVGTIHLTIQPVINISWVAMSYES